MVRTGVSRRHSGKKHSISPVEPSVNQLDLFISLTDKYSHPYVLLCQLFSVSPQPLLLTIPASDPVDKSIVSSHWSTLAHHSSKQPSNPTITWSWWVVTASYSHNSSQTTTATWPIVGYSSSHAASCVTNIYCTVPV